MTWLAAALLVACAVLAARPGEPARKRLSGRRRPRAGRPAMRPVVRFVSDGPRWRLVLAACGLAAVPAWVAGGPVAAVAGAVYAGLGAHEWRRRAGRKRIEVRRAAYLDELASLVAELRAGLPAAVVAAGRTQSPAPAGSGRLARLTGAVWDLAERTGAPAADLLDRIESDARAADRSARTAGAQAAGAQTTAMLLAALPLGGIAMGYLIGVDPLAMLLGTPLGAVCATGALTLQCAGLKWAQRLTESVVR